jgi:Fe-S-cluster containining protein
MADDPDPLERLVPALTKLRFPEEPLATCAHCAMAARVHGPPDGIAFTARARCCTYHPTLPNWLAGRALQRGDLGAERIRARLGDPEGVEPLCIAPGRARADAWRSRRDDAFGRDASLTCPFWAEGDLGCSIHRDRNAVCRTWFCKVERGARGHAAWMELKTLRTDLEHRLAERCVADGRPPASEPHDVEAWAAWYEWCADHVDTLDADALAGLRLDRLLQRVQRSIALRDAPMPDVLQPMVHSWKVHDDGVQLSSWSPYDRVGAPAWVFTLLAKLDGVVSWREAVTAAAAELGHAVPDEWVWHLWARGLLEGPDEGLLPDDIAVDVLPGS